MSEGLSFAKGVIGRSLCLYLIDEGLLDDRWCADEMR